jgi:putative tryptophan/tyrosine transport system substrate-binding protein
MRRRSLVVLLGAAAAAAAWPLTIRAQQEQVPVVGFLHSASANYTAPLIGAFRQSLKEAGLVEGQNITAEYRWADGHAERLPELPRPTRSSNRAARYRPEC